MRYFVVPAGLVLTLAGCATQDELRQTEVQQGQAVQALRADANRSESGLSDLRAEIKRTQDSVHALDVALTETRARAESAKVQADAALATSREFLGSLLAAREEQRRQLDANGVAFAELRRKAAELEARLQAQQRLIDQGNVAFNEAIRRLVAVEAGLEEAGRRSGTQEAKAKTGQESDDAMNRQLVALRKQVEETRAVITSEGLLQMMRGLEDVRRNSASLRGSIEELQKSQTDSAAQSRNYYLDLDIRIQALKQKNLDLDSRIQNLKAKLPAHEASASAPPAASPAAAEGAAAPEADRPVTQ